MFCWRHSLNQRDWQPQLTPKLTLTSGHLAVVDLMVESGEMQQAMQQKDADLIAQRVSKGRGLSSSRVERDSQITGMAIRILGCRETEHIRRFVLMAKGLVQIAQRGIVGQQDIDVAAQVNRLAGTVEETGQAGLGKLRSCGMVDVDHRGCLPS